MTVQYGAETVVVAYYAVYPNGRRCSVDLESAVAFGERWLEEGIRVQTVIRRVAFPIIGQLIEERP